MRREIRRRGAGLGHLGFGGCRSRKERVVPTLLSVGVDEERWSHGMWVSKPQAAAAAAASTVSSLLPSAQGLQLSPVWISSLSPSLPLAAYPLCLLVSTFSPTLTFLLPFSPLPPILFICLCVFLPVSPFPLCSASQAAIPSLSLRPVKCLAPPT